MQFRPILDRDSTTLIIQDLGNLEIVQEPLSALPGDSPHVGQMLLGDPQLTGPGAVLQSKQPPRTPLLNIVVSITGNKELQLGQEKAEITVYAAVDG